ncbi:MAG: Fe2+-dependent dioxygenase [Gammaproteobacteria bacterium]|nr:Fe2+-dependent dioxygenase [Gammaproteobacteria bacterium]
MLITVADVLNKRQLEHIHSILKQSSFVDGKLSAGKHAQRVKNNQELSSNDRMLNELNSIVMGSLVQNKTYQNSAFPHRIATAFYARYGAGMAYGDHIDDPVMGPAGATYRTDVSITVFLNNPEDYEGGELCINTSFGSQQVKLPAGHVVMYPSGTLHHVAEVTQGERLVAVTWCQSMIRDPAKRELLYNLNLARESLMLKAPDSDETAKVDTSYINLVRMWSEL